MTAIRVLAWLALAGLYACDQSGSADAGRPAAAAPRVAVVTLAPQRVVVTAELPARTSAYAVSDVRPQVSGILKRRLFTEGSLVAAGQPLYQIDDTLYQAALASTRAKLANARAALTMATMTARRFERLRSENSISQQQLDDAQAALEQAQADIAEREAELQSAQINLSYTRITAPIDGRIGRSYLTQGALVTANQAQALATIQTLDPIFVDVVQSSSELLALRRGLGAPQALGHTAVSLVLEDDSRYPFEGTLKFQEVVVDPSTGTVTLRAEFPNPDGLLLPGMFVRATIVQRVEPQALLIPQRGVTRDLRGNATTLVVDADGMVHSRALTVSRTIGSSWLVEDGVTAGEQVIVEGLQYVRPGMQAVAVPFADTAGAGAGTAAGL